MSSKGTFNIGWYLDRLSVMGPAEIIHRIGKQFSMKGMEIRYRLNQSVQEKKLPDFKQFGFCTGTTSRLPDLPFSFHPDSEEVEEILQGKIKVLGYDWRFRSDGLSWNRAPDTGKIWPRSFFGAIPYRIGNPYGDIRVVWEPSRLQHLITFALIARGESRGPKERAISLLETQFLSWVSENPFMEGIHYISAMECGLRLIAVCHALDLVRNQLRRPDEIWPALVQLVEEHAGLIEKRLSLYSSRGNHTVAESAALVYAGLLFPELEGALRWKEKGLSLLASEARRQILPDGGGVEQSFNYLAFISDLLGLVIKMFGHDGLNIPSDIQNGFIRASRFLSRIGGHGNELPSVGDSDNGVALSPLLRFFEKDNTKSIQTETFSDTGYTIIRNEENLQAALLFDHGALGMPPSYGHGHADALSVVFKLGDQEILIDPGTYTYNGDPAWRTYFKMTRAHNTVTVDGEDQSDQKASFIWSEPFRSKMIASEPTSKGGFRILARQNGYTRLKEGVDHFRGVSYLPSGYWLIWDYLAGKGVHTLDLHWHLGADFVERDGEYHFLNLAQPLSLSIEGGETTGYAGASDPVSGILGWRSPVYGVKKPITTLRTRFRGTLPHEFVTRIRIDGVPQQPVSESAERFCLKGWTI